METERATQVALSDSKPWLKDVARVEQELHVVREQEAWTRFGTIGFDAYIEWILKNSR